MSVILDISISYTLVILQSRIISRIIRNQLSGIYSILSQKI